MDRMGHANGTCRPGDADRAEKGACAPPGKPPRPALTRNISLLIDHRAGDQPETANEEIREPGTPESPVESPYLSLIRSAWKDNEEDDDFCTRLMEPMEVFAMAEAMREDVETNELDLSERGINDFGASNCALLLQYNQGITKLDLSGNAIGPEGATKLAKAVQQRDGCPDGGLTSLNLAGNPLGEEGALHVAKSLCGNTSLTDLNLHGAAIGRRGIMAITLAISENNRTLRSVDIGSQRGFSEEDAVESLPCLARMVTQCSSLRSVGLARLRLGSKGFVAIVEHGLQRNTTLETIDLRANRIDQDAAPSLARLVLTNRTLKDVNLSCNRLGDASVMAMAGVLPYSQGSVHLDLSYNKVGDAGLDEVTSSLRNMDRAVHLRLWGNSFSPRAAKGYVREKLEAVKRAKMKQYAKRKRPAGSAPYQMPALKIRCTDLPQTQTSPDSVLGGMVVLGGGGASPTGALRARARTHPHLTISPMSTPAGTPQGTPAGTPRGGGITPRDRLAAVDSINLMRDDAVEPALGPECPGDLRVGGGQGVGSSGSSAAAEALGGALGEDPVVLEGFRCAVAPDGRGAVDGLPELGGVGTATPPISPKSTKRQQLAAAGAA